MAVQLTEADGLLSNYVEEVAWDKQNRLWIATDKGVTVFNGSKMEHFTSANGLAQSYITELVSWPLTNAMMMLSPGGSLYCSDGKSIQPLILPNHEKVVQFGLLTDGNFFIAGLNQKMFIQWYVAKGLQFPKDLYPVYKQLGTASFSNFIVNAAAVEFTGKPSFLRKVFDLKFPEVVNGFPKEIVIKDADRFSDYKVVSRNDSIFWSERNKTMSFSMGNYDFKKYLDPVSIIYKGKPALLFFKYNSGNLLLISEEGNKTLIPAQTNGLAAITSMKMGPGGMVFISTMGQGIYHFKPGSFDVLFKGKKVARIAEDNDKYWLSVDDELVQISPGKPPVFSGIKADAVTSITVTKDFLHVTGISSYYKIPKKPDGLVKPSFAYTNSVGLSGFRLLANGSFDISTYTLGLFHFASIKSKPIILPMLDNIVEKTVNMDSGVAYTSYSSGAFIRFNNGKERLLNSQSGLLSNTVYDVIVTGDSIWVATEFGLNLVYKDSVFQYSKMQGFTGKRCLYTFLDKQQRRFVVSDACLMLLENGKLRSVFSYKIKRKGSSITSVLFAPSMQQLLLGTTDGLIIASVEGIKVDSTLVYPVIYEATTSDADLLSSGAIKSLPFGSHDFSFEVGYNYPDLSGDATLLYLLEGWNKEWQPVPSDFQLIFPTLPSGKYKLAMKAINADGFSSKEFTLLTFTILPPWYKQWYMIALYIIAFGMLFFIITRWWAQRRLTQQMEVFKMQQQLEMERNRISSELHDNVGSQLTNIIAQLDFLENAVQMQPKQVLLNKVEVLQQKARYTMGQLRESIWALKEDSIPLEDFVMKIRRLFEEVLVSESGIQYQIFPSEKKAMQLSPWQAVNLLRVLQEGLQNIQKHAMAKEVSLTFSITDAGLKIILKDDGKGIDRGEGGYNGHGLQNIQNRMKQLNGDFEMVSNKGSGTSLLLTIPVFAV